MRESQYNTFSLRTHKKNWLLKRPNVCQFELTFGCNLHCRHCYTDCYNKPEYIKKELDTKEVKFILDKVYQGGCIWLCFTGGDPLTRRDFLEIYSYAKDKGFIITVFINGYSMTEKITGYFKKRPPFVIELTLNAVSKDSYEKITRVKGSFEKTMQGINLILKARLPLKIKTQMTRDNLAEFHKIKKFFKGLGLRFQPSVDLQARLNGDLTPCNLRVSPQEVLNLNGKKRLAESGCERPLHAARSTLQANLFRCAIGGGDGIHIDPYGNTFLCNLIRKPAFNLIKVDIAYAQNKLLPLVRNRKFATESKCKRCKLREFCEWCPGKAFLERGDMEASLDYYCKLTHLITGGVKCQENQNLGL